MAKKYLLLGVLAALSLAACDTGTRGTSSGDGRAKLNINNSYADFGDYVVHVNALSTADLTPEVAQSYGIVRGEGSGLINLVVLEKSRDAGVDRPVRGAVDLSAANLTGQLKSIELREIEDGDSIYYIGVISVDDRETINFDFDVTPAGSDDMLAVRFSHTFYTK